MVGVVERFNPYVGQHGKRFDLFGFIDLVAISPYTGIIAIQTTSGSSHSAHKKKIVGECRENALKWILCGGQIQLWSWSLKKLKRGGKAVRWKPRIERICSEDFFKRDERSSI